MCTLLHFMPFFKSYHNEIVIDYKFVLKIYSEI
jgi:hypothetical protein